MEEVRVSIDEDGNVKLTVFGVGGPRCVALTEKLESLLGGDLVREFTSEYAQTTGVQEQQKVRQKA
ncbi:MAG: DUF2997 domain-containing protein [Chloroflexi bacterium]|nr:DUF2997 domain-containing protein [Deltaproteobacteria bacterium]MBI5290528.1 DUF2997 domain-containing protein [Chloroflexota bacterium]